AESTRIENYCDRNFRQQTYREAYNGSGQRRLRLRNFPVSAVTRVAIGSKLALTVTSDTATDLRAVVEVQDDRLQLTRHDSDGDKTQTHFVFTANGNETAAGLVSRINSEDGFSATLGTDCLSEDLFRMGGVNVMLNSAQIYFPDRDDIPYRIHDDRATLEFVDSADMIFYGRRTDAGLPMPHTFAGIRVDYTAGYDGLTEIPADLAQACIKLVQYAYNDRKQNNTLASESIGSYSYSRSQDPIVGNGEVAALLAQYVDRKS
ncbi:MAG: hypothetical protein ACYSSM_03535, partial [Planctomycetota bacterium]